MNDSYMQLIVEATRLSVPKKLSEDANAGFCGSALLAANGKVYTGISLSGKVGIQFCGEVGAVMSMLSNGETRIKAVAAVSNDHKLMPPCGRCREMIYQVNKQNLDTKFMLENDRTVTLEELLPDRWEDLWAQPESQMTQCERQPSK